MIKKVICKDCGISYKGMGIDLVLPKEQWNFICPTNGILCANCICKRIAKLEGSTVILAWIDKVNWEQKRPKKWFEDFTKPEVKLLEMINNIRQIN